MCYLTYFPYLQDLEKHIGWAGRDFEVLIKERGSGWAAKGWDHFYGGWPLKTPRKDFDLTIGGGLGWMKCLEIGQGKIYISCNYSCNLSSLGKILFFKLKYFYIQYAWKIKSKTWISIMKEQHSDQIGKDEKMMVLVKTFELNDHNFQLFQLSCPAQ